MEVNWRDQVYRDYLFTDGEKDAVVILPFLGEFGWKIIDFVRYVHWHPAKQKIVCCERGEECLYPSVTGFFYEWKHPHPDNVRCGSGAWAVSGSHAFGDDELRPRLANKYPDHAIVRYIEGECPWHASDLIKFMPHASGSNLNPVDIAIAVRKREFVHLGNYQHWHEMATVFRSLKFTVGLLGHPETSFTDVPSDEQSWNHHVGPTAGAVDMLAHCKFYIGTDTGLSHLAALMDVPSFIFRYGHPGAPNLMGMYKRANQSSVTTLPDECWDRPDEILGAAIKAFLKGRETP